MNSPMTAAQIAKLRCLHSGSCLVTASPELIQQINLSIQAGTLRDHLGRVVKDPIDGGLTNVELSMGYAIIDGTIQMMRDEAIPLNQIEAGGMG